MVAAISLGFGAAWLVGALAWGAHIAIDRSLRFDLRAPDGFPTTRRDIGLCSDGSGNGVRTG